MGYAAENKLLSNFKEIEEKINTFKMIDSEKAKYFKAKVDKIKSDLGDNPNIDVTSVEIKEIIDEIVKLENELDGYLKTTGMNKIKAYRVNLYVEILDKLKQLKDLNIERLKQLKQEWENEKNGNLGYSPLEEEKVENALAETFLEAQIKSVYQNNGVFNFEDINKFCYKSNYILKLKDKIGEKIGQLDNNPEQRLQLEFIYAKSDIEENIYDAQMWELIIGMPISLTITNEEDKSQTEVIPQSKNEISIYQENIIEKLMKFFKKTPRPQLELKIKTHTIFGKERIKTKKYEITAGGDIIYPEKLKNRIIEVVIPEGVKRIDSEHGSTFEQCNFLQKVTLPSTMETIGKSAFRGCKELNEINLPKGLVEIGYCAFARTNLSSVNLPEDTVCGEYCFGSCENLRDISLPKNMRRLPKGMFVACTKLTNINWTEKIERIGKKAFEGCINLKETVFPEKLEDIEDLAFAHSGLAKVTFPKELKKIGEESFLGTCLKKVDIPDNTICGQACFKNCSELKEVSLPKNMIKIPNRMFLGATSLDSVKYPENLEEIGTYTFKKNEALKKTILPKKCTAIGKGAFEKSGLRMIELPNNLLNIEEEAFAGSALEEIELPDNVDLKERCFSNCQFLKYVKLPNNMSKVPTETFMGCSKLEEVNWNQKLQEIGIRAFKECESLKRLRFPKNLKIINHGAFYECYGLDNVQFPEGLESIGSEAFGKNSSLTFISLQLGLRELWNTAFFNCTSITDIYAAPAFYDDLKWKCWWAKIHKVGLSDDDGEKRTNKLVSRKDMEER